MRKIEPGQDLAFTAGDERVVTRVKRVTEYPSFEAMLGEEDPRTIGGELGESKAQLLAVIRSICPPENGSASSPSRFNQVDNLVRGNYGCSVRVAGSPLTSVAGRGR
jgi:hypothetical protein